WRALHERTLQAYLQTESFMRDDIEYRYNHLRDEASMDIRSATGNPDAKLPKWRWNNAVDAKAFDIARYLLPQTATTSLGISINARRMLDMLSEWQSSDLPEVRLLGKAAQVETKKISPHLMQYGNVSDYHRSANAFLRELQEVGTSGKLYELEQPTSELLTVTPQIEDYVLASILFNANDATQGFRTHLQTVASWNEDTRREKARRIMDKRKGYEGVRKELEIGSFVFERHYDVGSFRDLQRQRGDRQQRTRYGASGFIMPEEYRKLGTANEYIENLNMWKKFSDDLLRAGFVQAAEYAVLMGNTIRQVVTEDPVQMMYVAPLRTQAAGHESYRVLVIGETDQAMAHLPAFEGLVPYDRNSYVLNRLPEEVDAAIRKAA
ncbi:MAG: FAD-dependent thymidylate synthase, partial [Candidatus Woesearchaeota archaeon]